MPHGKGNNGRTGLPVYITIFPKFKQITTNFSIIKQVFIQNSTAKKSYSLFQSRILKTSCAIKTIEL